jgi:hypothetical protein
LAEVLFYQKFMLKAEPQTFILRYGKGDEHPLTRQERPAGAGRVLHALTGVDGLYFGHSFFITEPFLPFPHIIGLG